MTGSEFSKTGLGVVSLRLCSSHQFSLRRISFSSNFKQQEVKEIGLYFPEEDLGIRKTRECLQEFGKRPEENI